MRKYRVFFVLLFVFSTQTYGAESNDSYCGAKKNFELFECRVKNICEAYKPKKPSISAKTYVKADDLGQFIPSGDDPIALEKAKKLYRENMENIYKCAMIQSQKNALDFLKKQLQSEKSGELDNTIGRQIELRINRLDLSANKVGCTLSDNTTIENKLNILTETSYEICKHISYMEYLKEYYTDISKVLGTKKENVNQEFEEEFIVSDVAEMIFSIDDKIAEEISHSYKVFPIVFGAYQEYESNFPLHFLLEVIHADFILLRQKMYQNIMPIAQVGYKIINAMTK